MSMNIEDNQSAERYYIDDDYEVMAVNCVRATRRGIAVFEGFVYYSLFTMVGMIGNFLE